MFPCQHCRLFLRLKALNPGWPDTHAGGPQSSGWQTIVAVDVLAMVICCGRLQITGLLMQAAPDYVS